MADEVHVTASQADAAKLIVERNSANGKPTPEAIRKIAEAQMDPAPEPNNRRQPKVTVSGGRRRGLRALLARMSSQAATTGGADGKG
jgi:hypothetical protein